MHRQSTMQPMSLLLILAALVALAAVLSAHLGG
jgi:hypothetical protein